MMKRFLFLLLLLSLVQCGGSEEDSLPELEVGVRPNVSPIIPGTTRNCSDKARDLSLGYVTPGSVSPYWTQFGSFYVLWAKTGYDLQITEIRLVLSGGPLSNFRRSVSGEELEFLLGAPSGIIPAPQENNAFLCMGQFGSYSYCSGRFSNRADPAIPDPSTDPPVLSNASTNFDKSPVAENFLGKAVECPLIFDGIPLSDSSFESSFTIQGEITVYGFASRVSPKNKKDDIIPFFRRFPVTVQSIGD